MRVLLLAGKKVSVEFLLHYSSIQQLTLDNIDTEYIMQNEKVRPIKDAAVLQNRLAGDNKFMYGMFFKEFPRKPIIFCSVKTQHGDDLRNFMEKLEEPTHDVRKPDTAILYSVNSPFSTGLAGNFLKSVMDLYLKDYTNIITFSPIPTLAASHAKADEESIRKFISTECPVYRFHTRNGADLWKVIEGGDRSRMGLEQSWGWQASYKYR